MLLALIAPRPVLLQTGSTGYSLVTDVDGNSEDRNDTVSVFNGPPPMICSLKNESEEIETVADWIAARAKEGVLPHEFGVFVRSAAQLDRARAAVAQPLACRRRPRIGAARSFLCAAGVVLRS